MTQYEMTADLSIYIGRWLDYEDLVIILIKAIDGSTMENA